MEVLAAGEQINRRGRYRRRFVHSALGLHSGTALHEEQRLTKANLI
jgi:hypothetical protein